MKLKTRLIAFGLMVAMLANGSVIPVYADTESRVVSTQITSENYIGEEASPMFAGPTIETIMYYITYYWPQVHAFLLRHKVRNYNK